VRSVQRIRLIGSVRHVHPGDRWIVSTKPSMTFATSSRLEAISFRLLRGDASQMEAGALCSRLYAEH
jgi:hypothetical protein